MRQLALSKQINGLIGWLVVTFIAAAIGATASVNASTFYAQLLQPSWAPPAWLFGPVWSALYLAMGIAAWLVWRTAKFSQARNAMLLFLVQLVLNALWSWVFFMWHEGALAFVNIVVLWCMIVATAIVFSYTKTGRLVIGAVSSLGEFCDSTQLCYLAIESAELRLGGLFIYN